MQAFNATDAVVKMGGAGGTAGAGGSTGAGDSTLGAEGTGGVRGVGVAVGTEVGRGRAWRVFFLLVVERADAIVGRQGRLLLRVDGAIVVILLWIIAIIAIVR